MAEFEEDLDAVGRLVKAALTSKQPKKGKRFAGSGAVNLNVLTGGRAVVQVNQKNE